ncbi:hypothetical protein L211DRAFT_870937 [Terfezia boudieri ATCC MYA-4762]|uniref:Uncharacterized protein n=1 Tax=Terfezia boudieri ATCC MYA-4762 TaxID=1051890 RepID=A0A3N4LAP8_9PEZI|nr:hypothetical protein L211DRAFT_870937 [Terfezia boudieri ATCC MYA-4762]
MIMTPPPGTNPVIHTLKACKSACSESERQDQEAQAEAQEAQVEAQKAQAEVQEAQAEANAERLMREESEADNQKLENKYEQAERKLQQAIDDHDRAQSERDSAINGKAQSKQDWHRVLMPLKEKFCTEWERGQEAKFERLRNYIKQQLADHQADNQKTITDLQNTITELMTTTRIHTQILSPLVLRNMLNECRDSFAKKAGYSDGWTGVKKELQDRKITLTEVKGKMEGALQHVDWGSNEVGKVVSFVIDDWPIMRAGNMSARGGEGAEARVYRGEAVESTQDESDKRLLEKLQEFLQE